MPLDFECCPLRKNKMLGVICYFVAECVLEVALWTAKKTTIWAGRTMGRTMGDLGYALVRYTGRSQTSTPNTGILQPAPKLIEYNSDKVTDVVSLKRRSSC